MPKKPVMDVEEQELIERARQAVTSCNWLLGECAFQWTERYSRGRTDLDFAALVGNETQPGHVGRCRRVWATFCVEAGLAGVKDRWSWLSWSHFDKARSFGEHAIEALDWAQTNDAPIRSMQSWAFQTWPELRSTASLLEETEQQEADTINSEANDTTDSPSIHVPDSEPVHAEDVERSEATRENVNAAPVPDQGRHVKRVLYAFNKAIEAFKGGMFQQADPDQQSELLEQTENFRRWLTVEESHEPAQGEALILLPRLQWCSRICNAKFVASMTQSTRILIQSAVDDLADAVKKFRQ